MRRFFHVTALLVGALPFDVMAGDVVYTPINPSFGGNSFNSAHLLGLATAQNEHKEKPKTAEPLSNSDRFVQMLEARLYSGLAQQVSDAIFGQNAANTGTIRFNDQEVFFERANGEIRIAITDFTTGQVTQISVPTL